MISRVHGRLVRRDPGSIEVLTPGGVAYEIDIPLPVYERLPAEGEPVELRTFQVVREDGISLFGFLEARERLLFSRLITVSGVGPRLGLSILSGLSPERLVMAITTRDLNSLQRIPGVGRKTAERLVLELADRLADLPLSSGEADPDTRAAAEAIGALVALGYSGTAAGLAVRRVLSERSTLEGVPLIKAALAAIGS